MRGPTRSGASPPSPLGILGFGSGLALVASILSGISLAATLLVVVVAGTLAARSLWARTTTERRALARRRLHAGAVAGIAALGAYDLSRCVLVAVLGFRFGPFDAFGGFGRALWGAGAQGWWVEATGVAVHLANGLALPSATRFSSGGRGRPRGSSSLWGWRWRWWRCTRSGCGSRRSTSSCRSRWSATWPTG
ncbi:MAG TPA: hypothetical protein VGR26_17150 [Acidimicrobiales bacterium]|nr:hypothetical protein [Acidimicrobiales bacterium]